jgi:lysine 2,3-aminomutase
MGETSVAPSPLVAIPSKVESPDGDEPPSRPREQSPRHPAWAGVPDHDWDDWRWQSQNAVRTPKQLAELLPFSIEERRALDLLQAQYKLAIPPYYFSLIDRFDPADPIRLQSVPSPLELAGAAGVEEDDPLDEDKDSPVPGLTHRYPDRALLVTTHVCTMYCRFCTRKRATMKRGGWDAVSRDDRRMVEYVQAHSEIRDVIVSGGDPLTLPVEKLEFFLVNLTAIPHVDVIRIGTRVPVTLPQRVHDPELMEVLEACSEKVWIQTHFNHAREVTPEAAAACRRLRMAGLPLNNHAVLMKGVNDTLADQRDLCRALLRTKVRPYYLFHCDPVTGAGHFRTSVWKGIEIIEGLRGHMSGLGIPTYVVDAPRGGGKIPLMPNYLISASDDAVVLRNYEGLMVRYHPTGEPLAAPAEVSTQGVSSLLEGQAEVLVPEGNPRLARRRARSPVEPKVNGNGRKTRPDGNGNGHGNGNVASRKGTGH